MLPDVPSTGSLLQPNVETSVETKDTREKRARRVIVAFAGIVAFAIAAFVVTMSLTTSYPSTPEPPTVARPVVQVEHIEARGVVHPQTANVVTAGADAGAVRVATPSPPAATPDELVRRARGGVLIDDGAAPRSPGTLGTLAREDVKAGVAAVKDKVKDCYERALKIDPELGGTVKVAFTLEADDEGKGVVTKGEVADSDMNSPSPFFEACVLKEIATAEFKAPGGGGVINVTYPFHFANDPNDAGP